MKESNYGTKLSLKDCISDIITDSLPYNTDEEKAIGDDFQNSRAFTQMLDSIVDEVEVHINYQIDDFKNNILK
ncbi:MAG: hypothetical protein Q8P44_03610 [Dehalococcoidia bacterium]|nr:hypothetical protein [Dehalococcoidia bacterium]